MKVEQLKAELVVFKGLMSNVSADLPLGSQGPSDGLLPLPVGGWCPVCHLLPSLSHPFRVLLFATVFFQQTKKLLSRHRQGGWPRRYKRLLGVIESTTLAHTCNPSI